MVDPPSPEDILTYLLKAAPRTPPQWLLCAATAEGHLCVDG